MSYNDDQYQRSGNPLGHMIKTAIGLSPLAFAGYKMAGEIKRNGALNSVIPFGIGQSNTGNLGTIGTGIGKELGSAIRDTRAGDLARVKSLTDELMKSDGMDRLLQATAEQNALTQSLLDLIDDPTSGLSNQLLGYKERLMDLARNETDPEKIKETIGTVLKAIDSNQVSESSKVRWEHGLREYRKLGPMLTPPSLAANNSHLNAVRAYNHVELGSIRNLAQKDLEALTSRYNMLANGIGRNRVSLVSRPANGMEQYYARVYSGAVGRSSYLATLPLHLGSNKDGVTPMFFNEHLTTAYGAPKGFLSAERAATAMSQGKGSTLNDLVTHAGMSTEDYFVKEFLGRASPKGSFSMTTKEANEFRSFQRQFGTGILPRAMYSARSMGANDHLNAALGSSSNIMTVVDFNNMPNKERLDLMSKLGTTYGFEAHSPGYVMLDRGLNDQPIGKMGIYEGSPLQQLKSIVPANRGHFPVESRIEQVFGREPMFVQTGASKRFGRGGVFHSGATAVETNGVITHLDENIEWAKGLTGATNKAVLIDVMPNSPVNRAFAGQGVALIGESARVRHFATKPLLEAGTHGVMASKLFEEEILTRLNEAGERVRVAPGEWIDLTKEQAAKHANFLGIGPNGLQYLRNDPRTVAMKVAYDVTEANGKRQINVMTQVDRDLDYYKVFGMSHKGLARTIPKSKFYQTAHQMGFDRTIRKNLGIDASNAMIVSGDMLKKGTGFIDLQMRSAYGMVANQPHWDSRLRELAKVQQYAGLGDSDLARSTGAVIKALGERVRAGVVTPKEAGHVLSIAYTVGTRGKRKIRGQEVGSYISGLNDPQALEHGPLKRAMYEAFGPHYKDVVNVASTGKSFAAGSFTLGAGPGDHGAARGSVEPRFVTNLQHRLQRMGFSRDETSTILASVYQQKRGFASHLKAAKGLDEMMESLTGSAGMATGAKHLLDETATYGIKDLAKLSDTEFDQLVSKHEKGFLVDFTKGADTIGERAVASAAQEVFGQGQVFFPGRDVTGAMRETFIKSAQEGMPDLLVHDQYTAMSSGILKRVGALASQTIDVGDNAVKAMTGFKSEAADLASKTWFSVFRGKIRGSQTNIASLYDTDVGLLFNSAKHRQFAMGLNKRAKGYAVFMDKHAFLAQLNDYMGTAPGSATVVDAAKKAEMFFLSPEEAWRTGNVGKAKGVFGLGTRHPELSLGNVTPMQFFREVNELGQSGKDLIQGAVGDMSQWKGIKSWRQVSALKAGQRHAFFQDFVKNIGKIAPEGGGGIYFPRTEAAVHIAGKTSMNVDMNLAGAAIGDFDGDTWMTMFLNTKVGKLLGSNLQKNARSGDWLKADALYKIKSDFYAEELKTSLKTHMGSDIEFLDPKRIEQGLLKEQMAKMDVGSLDTRLGKLRNSLLDMWMKTPEQQAGVEEALSMLKVLQEHAIIKSKKLPVAMPFGRELVKGIDAFFDTGNFDLFENTLRIRLFAGSTLHNEDAVITGVDSPYLHTADIAGEKISLNKTLQLIKDAGEKARVSGIADMPSANWMSRIMKEGSPEQISRARAIMNAGVTLEGAAIHSALPDVAKQALAVGENAFRRAGTVMKSMDRRLMGFAALGVATSMGVLAAINHQGYSPKPLEMPGEALDPSVANAISSGNLFSPQVPTNLGSGNSYPQVDSPINTPAIYVKQANSYQVRGQIPSARGLPALNDYVGSMGGQSGGSIRINDTRPMITSSFTDRVLGEY